MYEIRVSFYADSAPNKAAGFIYQLKPGGSVEFWRCRLLGSGLAGVEYEAVA